MLSGPGRLRGVLLLLPVLCLLNAVAASFILLPGIIAACPVVLISVTVGLTLGRTGLPVFRLLVCGVTDELHQLIPERRCFTGRCKCAGPIQ